MNLDVRLGMGLRPVEFSTGHSYGRGFGRMRKVLEAVRLSDESIEAQALPLTADMRSRYFDAEGVDMTNIKYITLEGKAESFP